MDSLLKKIITIVTITLVIIFVASWFQILPISFAGYGQIYPIPIIVIGLIFSAGGLTQSYKKIIRFTSLIAFVVLMILSVYYIFNGNEQSGVNIYLIWFIAVLALIVLYIILLIVSYINPRPRLLKKIFSLLKIVFIAVVLMLVLMLVLLFFIPRV